MDSGRTGRETARVVLSLLLLAGIGIGVYLAWHHDNQKFGDATARLANCPETAIINCELVNTSAWSELMGVPIAAYAIPTYLLTLILIWGGRRRGRMLGYAFCIGLLACAVSAFLFYISKTQIGFLCAWCLRLYAINLSIPVLVALAAWRSPLTLFGDTMKDLKSWPGAMRFTAGAFLFLLVATVAIQQGYRSELRRKSAEERKRIMEQGGPTVPASPVPTQDAPGGSTPIERDDSSPGSSHLTAPDPAADRRRRIRRGSGSPPDPSPNRSRHRDRGRARGGRAASRGRHEGLQRRGLEPWSSPSPSRCAASRARRAGSSRSPSISGRASERERRSPSSSGRRIPPVRARARRMVRLPEDAHQDRHGGR
jgi:uncharacterized membrane protein